MAYHHSLFWVWRIGGLSLIAIGFYVGMNANLMIADATTDIDELKSVCVWLFGMIWVLVGGQILLFNHIYDQKIKDKGEEK